MEQESSAGQPFSAAENTPELLSEQDRVGGHRPRQPALRALPSALYAAMTEEERYILSATLGRSFEALLRAGRAVFLEGLGIVFPETAETQKSYVVDSRLAIRRERSSSINFEKCVEVVTLHRERFGAIVEPRELATVVYPNLPLLLQLRWSVDDLKRRLQGLMKALKLEVVTNGVSKKLDKLGTFYALHNRHGQSVEDWFAGADIFLSSPLRWVTQVDDARLFDRPVLVESGELLRAAFGAPIGALEVDVAKELLKIPGISVPELPAELQNITINVFAATQQDSRRTFIFCSEGVRGLAIGHDPRRVLRCELTMEVAAEGEVPSGMEFPLWPRRAFALAAVLIAQQLLGKDCAWLGGSIPLAADQQTNLAAVLLQRFSPISHEQLCVEGEFSYVNILGITADELALGETEGLSHLLALLKRKGLEQMTRLSRSSVIARTIVNPTSAPPQVIPSSRRTSGLGAVQ